MSAYINGIAIFLIFSSFVSLIAPQKKYKEYVDLVMALGLILILINPMKDIAGLFDFNVNALTNISAVAPPQYTEGIEQVQKDMILQQYANDLSVHLKRIVESEGDLTFIQCVFFLSDADMNFGEIEGIYITLRELAPEPTSRPMIRVDRVEVTPFTQPKETAVVETSRITALKKRVSDFYQIASEHIFIEIL
jgi:hypothetical protein